ncbi:hypothetical protein ACO2Q3_04075 [Caulobacter sp. KR2-114]|uniref:hypothetical protein n=1 Tax=Caulobacter sp. KR2-114 TaxID=3400912 RepID=UPI003C0F879B
MTISSVNTSTLLQQLQQSLFNSLDKNADGVLSQSEFQSIGQNVPASANSAGSSSSTSTTTTQATSLSMAPQGFSDAILQSLLSLQTDSSSSLGQDPFLNPQGQDALSSFDPASAASNLESAYGTDGSMSKSQFESAYQGLQSSDQSGSVGGRHHHHHHHVEASDGSSSASASTTSSSSQADSDFAAADSNGDGSLSTAELSSYLSSQQQKAEQGVAQYQAVSDLVGGLMSDLISALKSQSGASTTASTTTATAAVTA